MVQNKELIENLVKRLSGLIDIAHEKPIGTTTNTLGSQTMEQTIAFLRLSIKYLLFDLDASRRENADLLEMINDEDDDLFC